MMVMIMATIEDFKAHDVGCEHDRTDGVGTDAERDGLCKGESVFLNDGVDAGDAADVLERLDDGDEAEDEDDGHGDVGERVHPLGALGHADTGEDAHDDRRHPGEQTVRGVADEISVNGEPADGGDSHDQNRDPCAGLAEAVAGHETEVEAALGGDDAHDAGENGEDGAGDQNGPDHMVEGKTDADRAAGLYARDNEHIAERNDEHGKEGLACGRRNGSLTVFIRGGFYSNILFFFHCEDNPFRFVAAVGCGVKLRPGILLNGT